MSVGSTTPLPPSGQFVATGDPDDLAAAGAALKRAYAAHRGEGKVYPWGQYLLQCVADAIADGRRRPIRQELSAEAKAARMPLPPEELVDAKQDRVHTDRGPVRVQWQVLHHLSNGLS